jgi:hypothetical protein
VSCEIFAQGALCVFLSLSLSSFLLISSISSLFLSLSSIVGRTFDPIGRFAVVFDVEDIGVVFGREVFEAVVRAGAGVVRVASTLG